MLAGVLCIKHIIHYCDGNLLEFHTMRESSGCGVY